MSSGLDMVFLKRKTASDRDQNRQQYPHPPLGSLVILRRQGTMATTSKQYKAIGDDLWKNKTEKIVRQFSAWSPS